MEAEGTTDLFDEGQAPQLQSVGLGSLQGRFLRDSSESFKNLHSKTSYKTVVMQEKPAELAKMAATADVTHYVS